MRLLQTPLASCLLPRISSTVSKDIAFKRVEARIFIEKFVVLSLLGGPRFGTIHSTIKKLKLMTYAAYKNGWIPADPFTGFYVKAEYARTALPLGFGVTSRDGCQAPQLPNGINRRMPSFSAPFTGLSHADVVKLTHADIHTDDNGGAVDHRQTPEDGYSVPSKTSSPVAAMLYDRYRDLRLRETKSFRSKAPIIR